MNKKHVLGFSGGADSQAVALWMRQRFPAEDIILLNSQAGRNEHPITTKFVRDYSERIHPVIECVPRIADLQGIGTKDGGTKKRREEFAEDDELTFPRLAYIKGLFPSRKAQFCTERLKLAPQLRWMNDNLVAHGIAFDRYVGVRRDESEQRKCVKDCEHDTYFNCTLWRPIASWSKLMVFAFLKHAGEAVNPLYTLGFSRVGCAPCINSGKDDIREWAARFPEMIDKVRQWEREVQRTFFPPIVPGLRINWVDEVVTWSKTAYGGKQPLLMFQEAEAAAGMCVSKYGLCE